MNNSIIGRYVYIEDRAFEEVKSLKDFKLLANSGMSYMVMGYSNGMLLLKIKDKLVELYPKFVRLA